MEKIWWMDACGTFRSVAIMGCAPRPSRHFSFHSWSNWFRFLPFQVQEHNTCGWSVVWFWVFNPVGSPTQINLIRQRAAVDLIMYILESEHSKYMQIQSDIGTVPQCSHDSSDVCLTVRATTATSNVLLDVPGRPPQGSRHLHRRRRGKRRGRPPPTAIKTLWWVHSTKCPCPWVIKKHLHHHARNPTNSQKLLGNVAPPRHHSARDINTWHLDCTNTAIVVWTVSLNRKRLFIYIYIYNFKYTNLFI